MTLELSYECTMLSVLDFFESTVRKYHIKFTTAGNVFLVLCISSRSFFCTLVMAACGSVEHPTRAELSEPIQKQFDDKKPITILKINVKFGVRSVCSIIQPLKDKPYVSFNIVLSSFSEYC